MNTGHGTGACPAAHQRGSRAEIKIDETLVSGPALLQWSGWAVSAVLLQLNQNFVVLTLIPSESELWRTEHQVSRV